MNSVACLSQVEMCLPGDLMAHVEQEGSENVQIKLDNVSKRQQQDYHAH